MAGHGGARPGAGRPRNADKYADQIASFHDQVAANINDRYAALQQLADGGFEQIEEEWMPAGLVQITKQVVTGEGTVNVRELAFPELPPEQLVCVKRKRSIAAPDFRANAYLVDRLAGKPTQATEVSGPGGSAVPIGIVEAAARIYGSDAPDEQHDG